MNNSNSYKIEYDVLNILACFAVVCLHVNGAVWDFMKTRSWVLSWFIETIAYWAVPVFFMLSGATLLGYRKRYDTRAFLSKRLKKVGIPFLFWGLFSVLLSIIVPGGLPEDMAISIKSLLEAVINCRGLDIYWFFPAIISVYFCVPFLTLFEEKMKMKAYKWLIIYAFVMSSLLPFVFSLLHMQYNDAFRSPLMGGYLLYVVMGYVIANTDFSTRKRVIIYVAGVFGWIMRFLFGGILSFKTGAIDSIFSGYLNVPCILFSAAVFLAVKSIKWKIQSEKTQKTIRILSGLSFGIYLIHFYILRFFVDIVHIDMHLWQWKIFGAVGVYLIAGGIVFVIKKVPVINKLVP